MNNWFKCGVHGNIGLRSEEMFLNVKSLIPLHNLKGFNSWPLRSNK
jgi:hypothetical protein